MLETARRADSLPTRASVCVVDPEWIDEGLLGKRLLPLLAHAKQHLLTPTATIVPARASVWAQLMQVRTADEASAGFSLDEGLTKYRWAPCYEAVHLDEYDSSTHLRCSEPKQVLALDFGSTSTANYVFTVSLMGQS